MYKAKGLEKLNEQLEKDESELKETVVKLESFSKSKERIQAAHDFRNTVKSLKYTESKELKDSYKSIQEELLALTEELTDLFDEEDIEPSKANKKIEQCQNKCIHLNNGIEKVINDGLKKDYLIGLEKLKNGYETYITSLLEKEFPNISDSNILTFQKEVLSMPDVNSLIQKNTFEKEILVAARTVSDSSWWNPLSWGRTKTLENYEYQDKVDMRPIWENISIELTNNVQQNISLSKKQASSQADKGKELILQAMNEIDQVWDQVLAQMKAVSANKNAREKAIQANNKKLAWYDEFSKELQSILSI